MTARHQGDPILRLDGVTVRYPGRREPALDGVGITAAAGEQVGVTGRTGAGKSTLALVAGGFIPRVVRGRLEGSAVIDGVGVAAAGPDALLGRVGIVFSTPANQLSASKPTVREELAFGLENLGVPRAAMDDRIEAVMDRLSISDLADREPFTLSGGEQQRVAIASIVVMGPRALVLDEPTAQLDPAGTAEVATLLDELAGSGTAILVTEHDPVVLGRTDRVAVLDGGRVVGMGAPGLALGATIGGTVGLEPPTLVRLAEAAGLDPAAAFDERALTESLAMLVDRSARTPESATDPGAGAWWSGSAVAAGPTAPAWDHPRESRSVSVEVEGLVHRYPGGREAVRGVTLAFRPGERVALIGQNGAGKTTLVKHLDGLLRPEAGEVRIDGRSIAGTPVHELAATVGFAFQHPHDQLFERTVAREVAFGPRNVGFDAGRVNALVEASLRAVGLGAEGTTNPYDLDLSRRKLVGLASVLAMDPAVLVLDEPTAGQDGDGVRRIGSLVRDLGAAGRTVIAVTHDMEFAARWFDRVVVMRAGAIVADGPPRDVLAAANAALLASTGLTPPPAARIAAGLGLPGSIVDAAALVAALRDPDRTTG